MCIRDSLYPVQQHVHARQVVGSDVLFHAVDAADAAACILHAMAHVEQQRARAAGEIEHAVQFLARTGFRILSVQGLSLIHI